jgi:Tol biopolymer transport system component
VDPTRERLNSWKEIAAFLARDVSTVQRWEKREGMPVHRHVHSQRGSVYAFRDELDGWWQTRRLQLESDVAALLDAPPRPDRVRVWSRRYTWIAIGIVAAPAIAALIAAAVLTARPAVAVTRFQMPAPPGASYDSTPSGPALAVSPDGRRVVAAGLGSDGVSRLWIHALDAEQPRLLAGTDAADFPFWSPDGRFIAFAAHGKLLRIPADGGPIETIADLPGPFRATDSILGASWNDAGTIVFADRIYGTLYRVDAAGGPVTALTTIDRSRGEWRHAFPQFLTDGRHYVFVVRGTRPDQAGIYVGALDSTGRNRIAPYDSNLAFVGPDRLLFVRGATLVAQRLDQARLILTGEPMPVAADVVPGATAHAAPFAAAAHTLAYRIGGFGESRLVAVNRATQAITAIDGPARYPANPAMSPDGKRVAIARLDLANGSSDIWIIDIARRLASRLTTHPAWELAPLWSPDGRRVVYASNRDGPWDLYESDVAPDPSGRTPAERLVLRSATNKHPQTWGAHGAALIYTDEDPATGEDLWMIELGADRPPRSVLKTPFDEREADLSADGRWLAYASDESGRMEVYVRPFPSGGEAWRISPSGGIEPRWRADGSELFYVGPDRRLMAVAIGRGSAFTAGVPAVVSDVRVGESSWWDYAVTPDGQQFIVKQAMSEEHSTPINVVLDWRALLQSF